MNCSQTRQMKVIDLKDRQDIVLVPQIKVSLSHQCSVALYSAYRTYVPHSLFAFADLEPRYRFRRHFVSLHHIVILLLFPCEAILQQSHAIVVILVTHPYYRHLKLTRLRVNATPSVKRDKTSVKRQMSSILKTNVYPVFNFLAMCEVCD